MGFSDAALAALLADAGLRDVKLSIGARKAGDPFTVLIASGRKPSRAARPGVVNGGPELQARA